MNRSQPALYELVVLEAESSRAVALPQAGRVLIGRAPECQVLLEDPSVSRQHAVLTLGDQLRIEDLGSANGTWLLSATPDSGAGQEPTSEPQSTRPGMVAVTPGTSALLEPGRGMMIGSKLVVLRARRGATHSAIEPPDATPILSEPSMRALYATAERVAPSLLSVLILGETGVGKEILAETVHVRSPRAAKPLLRLNCATLSAQLLESELFGHEQGAFTGASRAKIGLLQSADGGSVFLDEVGELPLDFQVKLLRVLEDRTLIRVGATKPTRIDVRFIAATNRDLRQEVARGRFREDLLYRLDGVTLFIPPLRERRSEIPALASRFAALTSRSLGLPRVPTLSPEAMAGLERHTWPGNIRELRHVVERAVVLCRGDVITAQDLQPFAAPPTAPVTLGNSTGSLPEAIASLERQRIVEALERCGGNQSRAAELLGISRRTLVTRLAEFGIPRPRKRP